MFSKFKKFSVNNTKLNFFGIFRKIIFVMMINWAKKERKFFSKIVYISTYYDLQKKNEKFLQMLFECLLSDLWEAHWSLWCCFVKHWLENVWQAWNWGKVGSLHECFVVFQQGASQFPPWRASMMLPDGNSSQTIEKEKCISNKWRIHVEDKNP